MTNFRSNFRSISFYLKALFVAYYGLMIETFTYKEVMPSDVLDRYTFLETRSAAKIAQAVCPEEFQEIIEVLRRFELTPEILLSPGGNRGAVPTIIDGAFAEMGWEEARVDIARQAYFFPGHNSKITALDNPSKYIDYLVSDTYQTGYSIDNVKGRVALDVEWNPKDGNLDRDFSAYRSWYEEGLIDVSFLITRVQADTRMLAKKLWDDYIGLHPEYTEHTQLVDYGTTTTSNYEKGAQRIIRGDLGLCPILMIGIGQSTWNSKPWSGTILRWDKKEKAHVLCNAFS